MHLSSSTVMSSGFLSKTQVNNFLDYTPPKNNFRASTEISPELLIRNSSQFGVAGQKYSPELESLRRDFNDQLRNLFYSLTGDVNALKKDNSENKTLIDELRRELDIANSKILQNKNANVSELNYIKDTVFSNNNKDAKAYHPEETVRGSWTKPHDYTSEISGINERIAQISRQLNNINGELEAVKKANYVPKDQFNKTMSDFIDELERKLSIINERVRERIEEMDGNLVRSLKDKEQDFNKLYYDIRSVQSSMIRVSDQVNTFTHSAEVNLESQVKKIIHGYHVELKNLSSMASAIDKKAKMMKKDESVMLGSGLQQHYQHKEPDTKFKELDTIYQSIVLLEKEMRSKVDMVDLNVNSIKRNLELELSIQLKNMILPLQNNIEQYLVSSDNRFVALEDAVLNHIKRESYVVPPERTSKLRGTMDFRDSPMIDDHLQYTNKTEFENVSKPEPYRQTKSERKSSNSDRKPMLGSETKEKGASEKKHFSEVESVVSMSQTVQSTKKPEWRYNPSEEKSFEDPSYHAEDSHHNFSGDLVHEDEDPEIEVDESEDETPATNPAKKITPDQDRNKKQKNVETAFRNLDPLSQPETTFRDFPSSSAFKSHLEALHPGTHDRPSSSKKKKPEIELNDNNNKGSVKEKSSSKTTPLHIESRIALGSDDFDNDEEPSPIVRKTSIETKDKKSVERGREQPEFLGEAAAEEFQGGVKGLLSKARHKRESTPPALDEEDYRPNRGKSAQKAKYDEEPRGSYGRDQPMEDRFRRNPLPNKSLERGNSKELDKKNQKPALPPVDTKNMKNFNKGAGLKPPQGKNLQNARQNMGNNYRGNANPRAMQQLDEEEDVEEVVYHVDEEGFLIDEQGNYLVDEQGNFLQLSPEQLREIEDNDLVYEKEF